MSMNISDNVLRQYIDTIFNRYDRDRSMSLDVGELANFFNDVFAMMGDPRRINQQQAYQALMMIDSNNDGRASKQELFNAFKRILSQNQGGYGGGQQGGWGNQGGYGQGGYNQGGYGQGGYNQGGYNQGGYGQGGYNQGGYNQGGQQGGWGGQQGGYGGQQGGWGNQGGYGPVGQGSYGGQQGWGGNNQQGYNAWGPTNNGGWGGGSYNKGGW